MNTAIVSGRVVTAGILAATLATSVLFVPFVQANEDPIEYRVTIENLSPTIITPPVVAFTEEDISYFEVGAPASVELEQVAEGGDTSSLGVFLIGLGASVTASSDPILPGGSQELILQGGADGYFHLATMLLPTNDAFAAVDAGEISSEYTATFYANSYDSGTEYNSELAAKIPGPITGGEGFNAERDDVNVILPHEGLRGDAEVDADVYGWEDPVLKVTVTPVDVDERVQDFLDQQAADLAEFKAQQAEDLAAYLLELEAEDNASDEPVKSDDNLVANGSFESASGDELPGWYHRDWGDNHPEYSVVAGYDSAYAARVDLSKYSYGDAKWAFENIETNGVYDYTYTNVYRSDVETQLGVRYETPSGSYQRYLGTAPALSDWNSIENTFSLPADATSFTVFHFIYNDGWLELDNVSVTATH